jgi:hypothetical protein
MRQNKRSQPFLRCTSECYLAHLGTSQIPIISAVPEPFDAEQYGMLSIYTIDGSKLSADQALALVSWISEDTGGSLLELLQDLQSGKCHLPDNEFYEVVWLDDGAQFWG